MTNESFTEEVMDSNHLSDRDLLDLMMRKDNPLSKAWAAFRDGYATIEQKSSQRKPLSIMQVRRLELDITIRIMRAAGVGIRTEPTS
jgi:hypothetical protein